MSDRAETADILFVCMGNICRSPFAEVLLKKQARRRLGADAPVRVHSAGVRGLGGHGATREMVDEARARGLDLSRHRGAGVDPTLLAEADLVLAMTESQRDHLTSLAPVAADRIFTLKELARLVEGMDGLPEPDPGRPAQRVRAAAQAAARRRDGGRPPAGREDVADPYGGSRQGYRRAALEIETAVEAVAAALFGEPA